MPQGRCEPGGRGGRRSGHGALLRGSVVERFGAFWGLDGEHVELFRPVFEAFQRHFVAKEGEKPHRSKSKQTAEAIVVGAQFTGDQAAFGVLSDAHGGHKANGFDVLKDIFCEMFIDYKPLPLRVHMFLIVF